MLASTEPILDMTDGRSDLNARLEALRVGLDRAANRSTDEEQKKLLAKVAIDAAKVASVNIADDRKAAILKAGRLLLRADNLCWRQWPTAYHEAGHAVVAIHLGIGLGRKGVNVIPDSNENRTGMAHILRGFAGRPDIDTSGRMRLGAEKNALATFAGEAAQRKYRPTSVRSWHASEDRNNIVDLLSYFVSENRELEAYYHWLQIRAENLIKKPEVWAQIQAVARALVKQQHLKPLEIKTICKQAFQSALEAHLRKA